MKKTLLLISLAFISIIVFPQDITPKTDTLRKDALNVFMSATSFIKNEINFINYVRDLKEADIYIISTSQSTGSGGTAYTYFLVGQNRFEGMKDTILVNTSPDDTEDVERRKQVNALKMGLMRYVLKTPMSQFFNVSFTKPIKETVSTDKWKNWVFNTSLYGYLDGEQSYQQTYLDASITADHVTDKNKFNFSYSYGWSNSNYDINGTHLNSYSRSQYTSLVYVKGLNDHWSVGGSATANSSVYSNNDLSISLSPGIEYDLFPYSEATRRQLRLLYQVGMKYNNYHDTTIYFKTQETLPFHGLSASYKVVEKWGSISLRMNWSNYLQNWKYNNLSLTGSMSFRIAKGLNLGVGGGASIVHDQLSLVKGGATYEEMLLRRKEIATQYTYYTNLSLSYTFGSIYNNAVNPRFGGIY